MELSIDELALKYEGLRIRDRLRESRLVSSILRHGQLTPVVVVSAEGAYVLIDGYARVGALRELSRDAVEGVDVGLGEEKALLLYRELSGGRSRSALEEGWWCQELLERYGRTPCELATVLERSISWVSRRLALVRVLPESVQEAVRRGVLSAQAAQKYLVPLARANASDCERLVARLGERGASVREMHELYLAWRRGDPEQRATLLEEPALYLASRAGVRGKEEARESRLIKDLQAALFLCRRLRSHLQGGALDRMIWREREALFSAWREGHSVFEGLRSFLEKEAHA